MLTSSPIASRATGASPGTFHYAPNRSPHQSPRVTAPLPRRHSKHAVPQSPSAAAAPLKSPSLSVSQPKPKQYVGVDAATQYSPMEPFDPTVPLRAVRPSTIVSIDEPHPAPTVAASASTSDPASTFADPPPEPNISPIRPEHVKSEANPLTPPKRRNSQDLVRTTASSSAVSAVTQSQTSSPKRVKPSQGPPKALPLKYEFCDVEDMVVLISNMLAELIETNDSIAMKSGHLTRFHSRTAPGISVVDYLHRLAKHATLTPPLLLSMVYYIDRLCALYPDFSINTLTVHRFLITAATVAGKGLSDSFWNNTFYARVGGVKVAELKLLELEFLYRVDWKIIPNPEVLVAYYKGLVDRCPGYSLPEDDEMAPSIDVGETDDSDDMDDMDGCESEQDNMNEEADATAS
ncbi:cyclin-domain-containing protein [Pseudomassariella vexata]|uniref:Cyclin-domain-containing protein n=1 Tax=Pseudomassariella vexata TaxID=1141098 RepID=A0A1Y2DXU8_9PEZI|nr:cyclin-domain-containing protein [Pseudomassariella vexata]ORY64073.1 cyclin-domain-containing protein [Pseudomassariella vexata]